MELAWPEERWIKALLILESVTALATGTVFRWLVTVYELQLTSRAFTQRYRKQGDECVT
jgi:hypothetical protein